MSRKRPKNKGVKMQLFLKCGTVDMYDMRIYAKEKLQLHHYPKFEHTRHTVFEESYLLNDENHKYIHSLEHTKEFDEVHKVLKENKKILMKRR